MTERTEHRRAASPASTSTTPACGVTRPLDSLGWCRVEPRRERTRRMERNLDDYQAGRISFAELDSGVKGWVDRVRFADT